MPEEGASPSEVHSEKRREESGEAEDIGGVVEAVRGTVPAQSQRVCPIRIRRANRRRPRASASASVNLDMKGAVR